ncbi:MAG: glycosyltransferase family 4 protein [Rhodospirillales bacterium]|nr:glycosyltransferase family 4 protein [Rhodospirillales bacterium]MDP6883668.1 glycosyltransferase family 4 protein [Rhodospirillales bacterium]
MTRPGLRDPGVKALLRGVYRAGLGVHQRLSAATAGGDGQPRLYYGGARAGDRGGPKVKIAKLASAFPEHRWSYNLVYVLSNAPYLPPTALRRLKGRAIPIVGNQNGVFYAAWYGGDWAGENRRMAEPYHLADHVFHQSEFCRRAAERFLGGREGAGEVLYNAVDTKHFVPRPGARDATAPFVFLVAGKVQAHQGFRVEAPLQGLAAARKQGLDARLMVAGNIDAAVLGQSLKLADRLGVGAQFTHLGPYRQEDAPALFGAAHAFVTANHNDACPTTVIEAMSSGLPVIYAASGGVPELVGGDAGVALTTGESWDEMLVPEPQDIGDAMLRVAENHAALSAAARSRAVERFDLGAWLERHRQVFQSLVAGRHG